MSQVTFWTDVFQAGVEFDLFAVILAIEAWKQTSENGDKQASKQQEPVKSDSLSHPSIIANTPQ